MEAGHTLLPIKNILNGVSVRCIRELKVSNITNGAKTIICFPNNEGANWVAFQNAIDQSGSFLNTPDKLTLKLGNLYLALFDIGNQVVVKHIAG